MTAPDSRYLSLQAKRLALLTSLSAELLRSRQDFVALDFEGFDRDLATQEELCIRLRSVQAELSAIEKLVAASIAQAPPARDLLARINAVQAEVRRLNAVNQ